MYRLLTPLINCYIEILCAPFQCPDCAAVHRSLGVHLTYVKSLNLDKWEPEQLMIFEATGGNQRGR